MTVERLTLLGGRWTGAADGSWLDVTDPADSRTVVARIPALTAADVDRAYATAAAGARTWRATDALSRGQVLLECARLLRARREAIVANLVAEMGKTVAEASVELAQSADFFEYYGAMARDAAGYTLNDTRPATLTGVRYEPVGVVLAITPWNDPLLTPARKLAPALFAGNAVILKPATETPVVGLDLAKALVDAGLPDGVLSVVTGRGSVLSPALLANPALAAVSFTGSNDVGGTIRQALAGRGIRVQAELGGKNATAVLADADLELAAETITAAAFAQAGQRCTATSRLVVERAVEDQLLDLLRDKAARLRLGPGADPATTMGPVVSAAQRRSVLDAVDAARAGGATVVSGGYQPAEPQLANGHFVEPTIVTDVTSTMPIWREEVFGPVLAVAVVDGFDEAVASVNDSSFGLSASVFTSSLRLAHRFVEAADTGQVAVNLPTSGWDVHHPFGGFRESGSPFKEQGTESLHFYTRVKTYAVRYG